MYFVRAKVLVSPLLLVIIASSSWIIPSNCSFFLDVASALPASLATSAFFLSLRDDDALRARAHRFLTSSRSLHNSEGHGRASKPDGGAKLSKRAFEALARCRHCLSRSRASFVTAKTPPLRSDAASFAACDESAAWSANEGAPRALQAILSSLALRASRHVATTKISGSRRHDA